MAKNKQQIKFEADISNLKTNIKNAQKSITSLNNELKLNQAQLKENNESTDLLSKRIEILKDKYEIDYIKPYNMFPRTCHVECICILKQQEYQMYLLKYIKMVNYTIQLI